MSDPTPQIDAFLGQPAPLPAAPSPIDQATDVSTKVPAPNDVPTDVSTIVLEGELMPDAPQPLPAQFKHRRGMCRLENITVENIEQFLQAFAASGAWYRSAAACGLSYITVRRLYKEDDDFRALCDESLQDYKEGIEQEINRRAIEGWDEPVFSQRTGQQMGVIRKYDTRLLELLAKRHMPEYREKFEGEIKVSGGVLVAPAAPVSLEDFQKQFGGQQLQLSATPTQGMLPSDGPAH